MNVARIVQLVILLVGLAVFAYALATWRNSTHTQRSARCCVASILMGGSAMIGALS